jgi:choline-sulfatase
LIAWAVLLLAALAPGTVRATEQPNILFIFADDQCYETIHALGNEEIETPNLDRLVQEGTVFTHAYNMGAWHGAVCVASRTSLNTGRTVWRARALEPRLNEELQAGRFWGQLLKAAGYETYMTGKWHVKADATKAFDHTIHVRPGMPPTVPEAYQRPVKGQADVWLPWDTFQRAA